MQLLSLRYGNTNNATELYELKKNNDDLVPKQVSARIWNWSKLYLLDSKYNLIAHLFFFSPLLSKLPFVQCSPHFRGLIKMIFPSAAVVLWDKVCEWVCMNTCLTKGIPLLLGKTQKCTTRDKAQKPMLLQALSSKLSHLQPLQHQPCFL